MFSLPGDGRALNEVCQRINQVEALVGWFWNKTGLKDVKGGLIIAGNRDRAGVNLVK
jgi:hypothetical protein